MITLADSLSTLLNTADNLIVCDLFVFTLKSGSIYYASNFDKDVVHNGHVYKHDFFISSHNQTKLSGYPTTDNVTVTIYADQEHNDNVNQKFVLTAAVEGDWDDAQCVVQRAFFNGDSLAGVVDMFVGTVQVDSVSGIVCNLSVKSEVTGLSAKIPLRIFAPQTVYSTVNGVVTTASTDVYSMVIPLKPQQAILARF